ncbi:MAG: hypothetical protein ACRDOI_24655 [Trebonia sp.]
MLALELAYRYKLDIPARVSTYARPATDGAGRGSPAAATGGTSRCARGTTAVPVPART